MRCHYRVELPAEKPKRERLPPYSASPIPPPVRLPMSDQTLLIKDCSEATLRNLVAAQGVRVMMG